MKKLQKFASPQADETLNTATMINIGVGGGFPAVGGDLNSLSKKLEEASKRSVVELLSSAA